MFEKWKILYFNAFMPTKHYNHTKRSLRLDFFAANELIWIFWVVTNDYVDKTNQIVGFREEVWELRAKERESWESKNMSSMAISTQKASPRFVEKTQWEKTG